MESIRKYVTNYFTTVLAILVVLNILVLLFIMMGIGWAQILAIPSALVDRIQDRNTVRTLPRSPTLQRSSTNLVLTSGVVNDPNLQLVCADETFSAAVSRVRPSVVNISCDAIESAPRFPGPVRFDDPAGDLAIYGGIGSGIVLHSKGYVLTALHIVERASTIYVTPFGPEAERYQARVVARDEALNLAMLRINTRYELPSATLGDSDKLEVADVMLAIGSPFGLEQSVTHGIVSDNSRDLVIGGKLYRGMLQTDVPINRGSSGGPLLNINGEVVAVNMAIYSPTGVYNGISFALPVDRAKAFIAKALP